MSELDKLYISILYNGLVAIRNASHNDDLEYCKVESEHLHEIPSLIGENNLRRHIYYLTGTRVIYLDWVLKTDRNYVREFVDTYYAIPWKRMDEILGIENVGQS